MKKEKRICGEITINGEMCQKKWGLCSDGKCINHSITEEAEKGQKLRKTLKREREGYIDPKNEIHGLKGRTYEEIYGAERVEEQIQKRKQFGRDNHKWRESLDKDWLYQKYWTEKLTLEQIADLCDCSAFYVRKVMGEYGIERRKAGGDNCKWTKKQKKAASERMKKKCQDPIYKAQRKVISKEIASRPEAKERWNKVLKEQRQDPEFYERAKETALKRWQDPKYAEKCIRATLKANAIRPNKTELKLNSFLQQWFPNEYKYVGSGEFILAGKCPDFVNVNGQKKIIELFGDYWHKGDDGKERIALFKQYGYETLIIWEHELEKVKKLENTLFFFQKGVEKD